MLLAHEKIRNFDLAVQTRLIPGHLDKKQKLTIDCLLDICHADRVGFGRGRIMNALAKLLQRRGVLGMSVVRRNDEDEAAERLVLTVRLGGTKFDAIVHFAS